jgi:tRNA (mo5U34)-methyltransferase
MAYRLANIAGFELMLNLDDRARSSGLWQYCFKPAVHAASRLRSAVSGAITSVAESKEPTAKVAQPLPAAAPTAEQRRILDRIQGIEWYHTIDLGNGVLTPGRFNHLPLLDDYRLPTRLDGMRALDVATMNGFWAFQMEKRGAREVLALDVEKLGDLDVPPIERARMTPEDLAIPRGTGFFAAKEILGSNVDRRNLNVYDLSPETTGKFDFVFVGDLLLHLMNPIKAAANICKVTSGVAHVVDCFSPYLPKRTMMYLGAEQGTWWGISLSALERILWDAGFKKVELLHKFKAPTQPGQGAWMQRAVFRCTN